MSHSLSDKHGEGLRDLLQEEVSNVTKRLSNSWQALVALTPAGEEPVHGMEIQVMREAKLLIEDLYGMVSRAALSHVEAPCATCNDDPAVCATIPGLRHCEKATRSSEAPSICGLPECKERCRHPEDCNHRGRSQRANNGRRKTDAAPSATQRSTDPYHSPAVKAMLRAAAICETYYADEVWTNTLARQCAFDLCQALKSEANKIAAEEHAAIGASDGTTDGSPGRGRP